ncbi:MAG: thioredoxin TrxC [Gammaproteobacteria bacterium]
MPLHIPCNHCNSINRVPDERLTDGPKCGKCEAALLPGSPVELTGTNFVNLTGKSDLPVVVDFWAPWCGPCKMMAPAFEQAAAKFETDAMLAKVNTENEPELSSQYNIRSIPTLIVFKHGRETDRQAGAMDLENLQRFIEQHLN